MSQCSEGSITKLQPIYVGENDELWMETINHKKYHVPEFEKIQS